VCPVPTTCSTIVRPRAGPPKRTWRGGPSPTWSGTLEPADPDDYILDARFLPVPDAIVKLETMPIRCMQEPIVSYLRGETGAGALWCYRRDGDGNDSLVEVLCGAIGDR
jgi:hypothetical protein